MNSTTASAGRSRQVRPPRLRPGRIGLAPLWNRPDVSRLLVARLPAFQSGRLELESVDRGAIRFVNDRLEATYQVQVRTTTAPERIIGPNRFARILLDMEHAPDGDEATFMLSPEDPRLPAGILEDTDSIEFISRLSSVDPHALALTPRGIVTHRFGSRILWRLASAGLLPPGAGAMGGTWDLAVKFSRRPPTVVTMAPDGDAGIHIAPVIPLGTMGADGAFLTVSRWTRASSLHTLLSGSECRAVPFQEIGTALASFHRRARSDTTRAPRSLAGEVGRLKQLAAAAANLLDNVSEPVGAAIARLEKDALRVRAESDSVALLHGDLHDKQVLLDGSTVVLVDLDSASPGDPSLDLGNLAAHLLLRGHQRGSDPDQGRRSIQLLVNGYRSAGGQASPETVSLYLRATLIRLVLIYLLRMESMDLFATLLSEEERIGNV